MMNNVMVKGQKIFLTLILAAHIDVALAYGNSLPGWFSRFESTPEGQLVLVLLPFIGVYAAFKALDQAAAITQHRSNSTYRSCLMKFVAGVLLYYPHVTISLIYNSLL